MYIPSSYAERDLPTLHAFVEAHPMAAVVTGSNTSAVDIDRRHASANGWKTMGERLVDLPGRTA